MKCADAKRTAGVALAVVVLTTALAVAGCTSQGASQGGATAEPSVRLHRVHVFPGQRLVNANELLTWEDMDPVHAIRVGDAQVARDLADTLAAHMGGCVGMAANMIGERKRIVAVVDDAGGMLVMLNPEIASAEGPYDAEEGCLSLPGTRPALRYRRIAARWQDESMAWCEGTFEGRVAQAIQHEIDHCDGVLV